MAMTKPGHCSGRLEIRRLTGLIEVTSGTGLVPWLASHPIRALRLADDWCKLLATVRWIERRQAPGMYLRQVDVPGVDTKFIERHKGVLSELLDIELDPSRVDLAAPDFAQRYGFLRKPSYLRFRAAGGFRRFSELSVRMDELTAPPDGITHVYVIENEITYLAVPVPAGAMVLFGGGYAVSVLQPLGWLAGLDIVYWGDIDTHSFAILNRLRHRLPHARSMLMDRVTLLAHRDRWIAEPSPSAAVLDHLDSAESASTPTLFRTPMPRRSAWNKNGSASLPSKRQSPTRPATALERFTCLTSAMSSSRSPGGRRKGFLQAEPADSA